MARVLKFALYGLAGLVGVALALFLCLVVVLSVFEYRPKPKESITETSVEASLACESETIPIGEPIKLLSWNIGYASLGESADFFLDGGKMVYTASLETVNENLLNIAHYIEEKDPNIVFLQEVDKNSSRSRSVNEVEFFSKKFPSYVQFFARNYKCLFVPYPLPPIGTVEAGLVSMIPYSSVVSERIQLPVPFKWPMKLVNLKRCVLISRVKLSGSAKELVLINVHLEAYDDGEGKALQTEMLKNIMEAETQAGNYVIVGGDFNQVFSSVDSSMYPPNPEVWIPGIIDTTDFPNDYQFLVDNSIPTCRSLDKPYKNANKSDFIYYLIDGFIVSPNVKVLSVKTEDLQFKHSDHNPILLEFVLEE